METVALATPLSSFLQSKEGWGLVALCFAGLGTAVVILWRSLEAARHELGAVRKEQADRLFAEAERALQHERDLIAQHSALRLFLEAQKESADVERSQR